MKYLALIFDVWKRPAAQLLFCTWMLAGGLVVLPIAMTLTATNPIAFSIAGLIVTATLVWFPWFRLKLLTWVGRIDGSDMTELAEDPAWWQAGCILIAVDVVTLTIGLIRL